VAKKSSKAAKSVPAAPAAEPKRKTIASKPASAPLSNAAIGEAAGEVWTALSGNGGLTIAALKKAVDVSGDLAIAGLGWLAREDKVEFDTNGRNVKVSLK